jgi:ribosomal protein S18 acetylase RimI-like enzyme
MISAANEETVHAMLAELDPNHCRLMIVHESFAIPIVEKKYNLTRHVKCVSSAYLGPGLPEIDRPDLRIDRLGTDWVGWVCDHYAMDTPSYVRGRIEAGEVWGVFSGEQILGFIGLHEEGSMGMLVILEEHRRQGLAEYLVTFLTNSLLTQGRIPHDHIIVGNDASERLQRKMGFEISTRNLWWMTKGIRGPYSDIDTPVD